MRSIARCIIAPIQVFDLLGLAIGAVIATRLAARDIALVFRMLAVASVIAAGFPVLFALAPNVPIAFIGNAGIDMSLAVVGPGVLASLSLAIPSRTRSVGFSIGALFVLPGLLVLPIVGAIGDAVGFRYGMLMLVPVFVIGGLIVATAGSFVRRDVQNVWTSMRTRGQMLLDRQAGKLPLLAVQGLSVGYDGVEVLAGIGIEVAENEIVAIVGTNGAGKSTLLRAISGVTEADHGAIVFDGRARRAPAARRDRAARRGPSPRRTGHLPVAADRGEPSGRRLAGAPPGRARRRHDRGGPRDVPGTRLPPVRAGRQPVRRPAADARARHGDADPAAACSSSTSCRWACRRSWSSSCCARSNRCVRAGTAILLVEQSMNVAVAVADRVYVMETGAVRFSGSAAELAAHPELLWSVYIDKASESTASGAAAAVAAGAGAIHGHDVPALEVDGVSVNFGGIAALDGVSLQIHHGEVVGIIGPNGAGKTTLFDVISGFLRPDSGEVLLDGTDVTSSAAATRARLGLGRSFQDSQLFAGLTVREALAVSLERFVDVSDPFNAMLRLPAQVRTETAVSRRVDELMELFGIGRFADNLVSELSTGSRRLVDLAAVLAHQPSVILLDEPSSGVAQREVEAMGRLLRNVRDRLDATLLIVEHDIAFIAELADRLIALDRGAVIAAGEPRVVLALPEVGEAFLGTDPLARTRSGPRTEVDTP